MDDPRVAALIDKGMQRNPQAVQDAMAEIGKLSDKQLAALTVGKQADTSGLDKMNQADFDNLLKASPNLIKAVEKLTPEEITKLKGIADSQKPGKHDDAQSSQMLNMLSHMPPDKIASAAKMFASFSPGDMHMMMNLGDRFGGGKGKQNPQMMNNFLNQMESLSPRQRHTVLSTLNSFSAGEMNKLRRLSGGGGSMDLHQVLEIAPYTKYIKMGLGFM